MNELGRTINDIAFRVNMLAHRVENGFEGTDDASNINACKDEICRLAGEVAAKERDYALKAAELLKAVSKISELVDKMNALQPVNPVDVSISLETLTLLDEFRG